MCYFDFQYMDVVEISLFVVTEFIWLHRDNTQKSFNWKSNFALASAVRLEFTPANRECCAINHFYTSDSK